MKCLVLEDRSKKEDDVRGAFSRKGIDAIFCTTTNEFLTALNAPKFDAAFINAEAWGRSRAVCDYFGAGKRLEGKQVIFYNASEQFIPAIKYRKHSEKDMVYREPVEYETLAAVISN